MAKDITVTVELSHELLAALGRAAERHRAGPADYLRHLLRVALDLPGPAPGRRDHAVRIALAEAADWPDLQRRLRACGCVLRSRGVPAELSLCTWPRERPLLPLAAFGTSREELVLRFGVGFPPESGWHPQRDRVASAFRARRAA